MEENEQEKHKGYRQIHTKVVTERDPKTLDQTEGVQALDDDSIYLYENPVEVVDLTEEQIMKMPLILLENNGENIYRIKNSISKFSYETGVFGLQAENSNTHPDIKQGAKEELKLKNKDTETEVKKSIYELCKDGLWNITQDQSVVTIDNLIKNKEDINRYVEMHSQKRELAVHENFKFSNLDKFSELWRKFYIEYEENIKKFGIAEIYGKIEDRDKEREVELSNLSSNNKSLNL